MKTFIVLAFVVGLAASENLPFNFTVFGIGNPVYYHFSTFRAQRASPVLFSELNGPTFPSYRPYRQQLLSPTSLNDYFKIFHYPSFNKLITPSFNYRYPQNTASKMKLYYMFLKSKDSAINQYYPSSFYPHFRPQNSGHLNQLYPAQLYPFPNPQELALQFNPLFNRLNVKTGPHIEDIRYGPVIVLVRDRNNANQLVAVHVQEGLQSLGQYPHTKPLEEALQTGVAAKTAFLFSPVDVPLTSRNLPVSRLILPNNVTVAHFANGIITAPTTPFLLLVDDDSNWVSDIKKSFQTFELGRVEVIKDNVLVIPRPPVQPTIIPVGSLPVPEIATNVPQVPVAVPLSLSGVVTATFSSPIVPPAYHISLNPSPVKPFLPDTSNVTVHLNSSSEISNTINSSTIPIQNINDTLTSPNHVVVNQPVPSSTPPNNLVIQTDPSISVTSIQNRTLKF